MRVFLAIHGHKKFRPAPNQPGIQWIHKYLMGYLLLLLYMSLYKLLLWWSPRASLPITITVLLPVTSVPLARRLKEPNQYNLPLYLVGVQPGLSVSIS